MNDPILKIRYLPAPLIISKFVENKENCNYENYMRELVNASSFFLNKSNNEFYEAPDSEDKGQPDCISDCYSFDLKLLLPETAGIAKREFTTSIVQFSEGFWGYGEPRKSAKDKDYKPINGTLFHCVFRKMNYDDLLKYEDVKTHKKCKERDVNILLKDMQTHKNLLCLVPYKFSFENDNISHSYGQAFIANAIAKDYGILFEYRSKKLNNSYETFISFIYDGSLTILGMKDGKIDIVDEIPLKNSETYLDLSKYLD